MAATSVSDLPKLSSSYRLPADAAARYARDGHVLLRRVCSPDEVASYRPVITTAVEQFRTETRTLADRDTYGKAFLQVMNLWRRDERVRRFVLARRFAQIAAELLGVAAVRLYHDQALYKEAGGGHTPWHQDQYYWPLDTDKTVTMWMPLVDVSREMGPVTFASRSHHAGFLGHMKISDEAQTLYEDMVRDRCYTCVTEPLTAGDATFHAGWTLHSAPANSTDRLREVMTIIYFADGARVIPVIDNPNRADDLRVWLPGIQPGGVAASELNPVVFGR